MVNKPEFCSDICMSPWCELIQIQLYFSQSPLNIDKQASLLIWSPVCRPDSSYAVGWVLNVKNHTINYCAEILD